MPDQLFGVGEAAGGQICAVVLAGQLSNLELSPHLLRRGGTDSTALAAEITTAVNAAIADLTRQIAVAGTSIVAELDQVNATFTRAVEEVTAELERAERRLDR